MSEPDNPVDLASGPIAPALLRLVAPMLFGMLMIASVGIVDAYFIGDLGTEALAAFGLCFPVIMMLQALLFGLANGITASIARTRGERAAKPTGVPERVLIHMGIASAMGLASTLALVGFLFGRFFFGLATDDQPLIDLAMEYYGPFLLSVVLLSVPMAVTASMRGLGETRSSATVMALTSFFNAGLDPVFMNGWGPLPAMGIAGVSIATVVANGLGACAALVVLYRALGPAAFRPAPADVPVEDQLPGKQALGSIATIALPAMLAQLFGPLAGVVIATLMAAQGTFALAGLSIVQRVDMLVTIVSVATGAGLMPLVGQSWGGGDRTRAALALRIGRRMLVLYAIVMGLVLNLLAGPLVRAFSDTAEVDAVVRIAFMFAPLTYIGAGLNISTMSCFNAIGRPIRATQLSAVYALVLLPVLATVLGARFGVLGIFAGAAAASLLSAVLGTYWMKAEGLSPPVV